MRRPVTLLCLADIHCEKEEFKYFSWLADSLWYYTMQSDNNKWRPDYLIVAGDIVFAKRQNETENIQKEKYHQAGNVIEEFTTRFPHLKDGHIVIVPGNHDKALPEDLKDIIKERDAFFDYIKRIDDTQNKKIVIARFSEIFEGRFKLYLDFIQKYQQDTEYNDETIINNNIRNLAGIRAFPNDNLCFVPINTEWLYISGKEVKRQIKTAINGDFLKILNEAIDNVKKISSCVPLNDTCLQLERLREGPYAYEEFSIILKKVVDSVRRCSSCSPPSINTEAYGNILELQKRVDKNNDLLNTLDKSVEVLEKCSLCSPLIKDAYEKLVNNHKRENYTVITVMHRGPEYLPYKDINPTDKEKPDSLGNILQLSDILFTGHEHQTRTDAPPSYIGNSVLHFKLGSVGRKEKNASEHIRWASLIHIDPISGSVEHLPVKFNNNDRKWEFKPNGNIYSLRNKYDFDTTNNDFWEFNGSIPVLNVKSPIKDIIEEKIRKYFEVNEDAVVIDADRWDSSPVKQKLIQAINNLSINNQQMRVIVYYRAPSSAHEESKNRDIYKETMKKVDRLRAKNIKFILLNMLIINEVIIESR